MTAPARRELVRSLTVRGLALPTDTPPAVRRLLRRCLQKNARERLHDISDARIEMQDARAEAAFEAATLPVSVVSRRRRAAESCRGIFTRLRTGLWDGLVFGKFDTQTKNQSLLRSLEWLFAQTFGITQNPSRRPDLGESNPSPLVPEN